MAKNAPTYFAYRTPHGPVTIRACGAGITHVVFGDVELDGARRPSEPTNRAATQLQEYFAGKRRTFDVPLALEGSLFQQAVWNELARVPYGETVTNAQLARRMGKPSAYRAVGAAVHENPAAIVVPDHRVVGANGRTLGAGAQARLRCALLGQERSRLNTHTKGSPSA